VIPTDEKHKETAANSSPSPSANKLPVTYKLSAKDTGSPVNVLRMPRGTNVLIPTNEHLRPARSGQEWVKAIPCRPPPGIKEILRTNDGVVLVSLARWIAVKIFDG
jgi:hypothetical protein